MKIVENFLTQLAYVNINIKIKYIRMKDQVDIDYRCKKKL